jgi:hypothetical protein
MKTYKVRVTNSPANEMAYGGQSNYGLDIGSRNVYTDQPETPYEGASGSLQPIDRDDANIEAEKNETALGDFTGDGILRHFKIGGKRHSEGGTPLNVPEGTFIFSDTAKMKIKDPQVLNFFGIKPKKGGITPAKIASGQYGNLNKFTAILEDPNRDDLAKKTAAINREGALKKLGMLAFYQESKKNFPQGIPDVARPYMPDEVIASIEGEQQQGFESPEQEEQMMMPQARYGMARGGELPFELERYQSKGQVNVVKKTDIPRYESEGYKRIPGTNTWEKKSKVLQQRDVIPGTPGSSAVTKTVPGKKYVPNENAWWRSLTPAQKAAHNAKVRQKIKTDPIYQDKVEIVKPAVAGTEPRCEEPGFVYNPSTQKCEKPDETLDRITYNEDGTINKQKARSSRGVLDNYLMYPPPNIYFPDYAQLEANIPEPTFYDPTRELAEQASTRNTMARYASQLDPQAYSARANALQAQGAEQAANTMGRYQNLNVGVANQFAPMQSDIANKLAEYRANRYNQLMTGNTVAKQQYDNSMREYINYINTLGQFQKKENMMRNMINAVNPYFNVDVDGNVDLRPGYNPYDYITGGNSTGTAGGASGSADIEAEIARLKGLYPSYDAATLRMILERNPKFANKTTSRVNPAAAFIGQYGAATSAYPFGDTE